MTKIETAATAVTSIEHALKLLEELGLVIEFVGLPVERMASGSLETPLAFVG
jgi:hypothetical protein